MLKLTTPATTRVIALADLKARLRIDTDDDDGDLEMLLAGATGAYEGRTQTTLRPTGYQLRLTRFMRRISLPAYPVRGVDSVVYVDENGDEQTVAAENYSVIETPEGADVVFLSDWSAPSLHDDTPEPVRVNFSAGYDDPEATAGEWPLPESAVLAVCFLVGHWYEHREAGAAVAIGEIPLAFDWLAGQARVFR